MSKYILLLITRVDLCFEKSVFYKKKKNPGHTMRPSFEVGCKRSQREQT